MPGGSARGLHAICRRLDTVWNAADGQLPWGCTVREVLAADPALVTGGVEPRRRGRVRVMRRVVVTGLGVVAPNGVGKDAFWSACLNGRSGVGPIRTFDASGHPVRIAAEVPDFSVMPFIPPAQRKSLKIMGRAMRFAVGAAGLALQDSGLTMGREDPERVGVVMGTGLVPVDLPELTPALVQACNGAGKLDVQK